MSESRRKEFGTKENVVWAEVVKTEKGAIITSFRSETETRTKEGIPNRENLLEEIRSTIERLGAHISDAQKWVEVTAVEMAEQQE